MKDLKNMKIVFYQMMKDYNWMKNECERLHILMFAGRDAVITPARLVAAYGEEVAMPYTRNNVRLSQAELKKLDKRAQRNYLRLVRLKSEVAALEYVYNILESEIQQTVYDMSLDGESLRVIANHLDISRDKAQKLKDSIVELAVENPRINKFLCSGEWDADKSDKTDKSDKIVQI